VADKKRSTGSSARPEALARIEALERELADLKEIVGFDAVADVVSLPPDAKTAVASLRAWIGDDRHSVRVRDLVARVTGELVTQLSADDLTAQGVPFSNEELQRRVSRFAEVTTSLASLFVEAGYWGAPARDRGWARSLQRVANAVEGGNGLVVWLRLRLLPALMLEYAGGVAAAMNEQYESLNSLLTHARLIEPAKSGPLLLGVYPSAVMEPDVAHRLPGLERRRTPVSDWLHDHVREPLRSIAPDEYIYDEAFDRFEYLFGAAYWHQAGREWAPIGRFAWKDSHRPMNRLVDIVSIEFDSQGKDWLPFRAGLLGPDLDAARSALSGYNAWVSRAASSWF
jgi:hypothetical protein